MQLRLGRPLHVYEQIEAIEQRTAQTPLVAPELRLCAAASVTHAREPAGAWIRRRHQHERGGEGKRALAADDRDVAILERLP
jgi:hypothetical protein